MMKEESNAFPIYLGYCTQDRQPPHQKGMSLRAYIAARVLPKFVNHRGEDMSLAVDTAVTYADALIRRLEK